MPIPINEKKIDQINSQLINRKLIGADSPDTFITPITDLDRRLFTSYLPHPSTLSMDRFQLHFEDSFEYIRMYFNSGWYQGFKFYDNQDLIIFALENKKKPHFKIFKPLGPNAIQKLPGIITALSKITRYPIQTVCVDNKLLNCLKKTRGVHINNIKEFKYYIYDLKKLPGLRGKQWKNVRQKISTFKKHHQMSKLVIEPLSPKNFEDVVHFIGGWRKMLLTKRGFSYANSEKNKFAARYYADLNDFKALWSTVYKLHARVVAFQLLYRLGSDSAAHAIGLADPELKGLSETTQVHIWEQLHKKGIRFINDGPSWRPGLERYKQKFNPIAMQQVFECKLRNAED